MMLFFVFIIFFFLLFFFFFFQAEDGIRDRNVTGVQTCALPIFLYVLDEPSIGLHPRDNRRLLDTLAALRDLGNTVLVVEHDEETIRRADYVVDLGPGAGTHGGSLVALGPPEAVAANRESITGLYISG